MIGVGYASIAQHIIQFHDLNAMPSTFKLNVDKLDGGSGIEDTLRSHSAAWHKSCRNKINNLKLDRALKRNQDVLPVYFSPIKIRRLNSDGVQSMYVCIFCDKTSDHSKDTLHKASTFELDFKVRKCATDLQDTKLLAKLAGGDLIAIDALYHTKCLLNLYDRAKQAANNQSKGTDNEQSLKAIAFAQLLQYIEEFRDSEECAPVFNLMDLSKLYSARLHELGVNSEVHSTRLKEKIISAIPDLTANHQGRNVVFLFNRDIGRAIKQACDLDTDALTLAKAAKILRRDMFEHSQELFNGSFIPGCQQESVPLSMLSLVSMILDGPSIKDQSTKEHPHVPACLTIAQLMAFNTVKTRYSATQRHHIDRETPLPIYLALKIHGESRNRTLIDKFHKIWLCILYGRVLSISTDIGNSVCQSILSAPHFLERAPAPRS